MRKRETRGRPINGPMPRVKLKPRSWPNAMRRLRQNLTFDGYKSATQEQVAAAIGVGTDRYFQLETGGRSATPREAKELARLFNVTVKKLRIAVKVSPRVVAYIPKTRAKAS